MSNIPIPADLATFTEEILNGKLHFLIIFDSSITCDITLTFEILLILLNVKCFSEPNFHEINNIQGELPKDVL